MVNFSKKYFSVFFFLVLMAFGLGQEKNTIDSLESLLKKETSDSAKVGLLLSISENLRFVNFGEALEKAIQGKNLSEKTGYKNGIANSALHAGLANYFQGNFEKALAFYLEALRIFEEIGDSRGEAVSLNNIGNLYRKNGDYKNAVENFSKAETICKEMGHERELAVCFDNLGVAFDEMNELGKALDYYLKSLAIDRKLGFFSDIPYSLINAAGIYAKKGDYQRAQDFYRESLEIREELNDRSGMAIILNDLGELHRMKKDFPKAISSFKQALALSVEIKYKDLERHIYQMLAETYALQNNFSEAYRYSGLSYAIKDEIFNEQKSRQIAEVKTRYETEKKEKEIEIQDLKIRDQEMQLSQRNIFIIVLFAGLVMITLLTLLVYRQQKLKQKQIRDRATIEKQEQRLGAIIEGEEKERRRLSEELHDGLGQLLSTVKLNISGLEGNVVEEKENHLVNSLSLIDEACSELRNISHNLMPGALIKLGLIPALREFTDKINQAGNITVIIQTHGINDRFGSTIETGLFRIIQEVCNNIIKHAKANKVTIQLIKDENLLTVMIEDDGVGFDINKIDNSNGIGWKNIKSRVTFLKGIFDIDSHHNRGTTVTIEIPVMSTTVHSDKTEKFSDA